jgi:hypothetical protein
LNEAHLAAHHLRELTEGSGIALDVIEERGYRTADRKALLESRGFSPHQRRVPALVIPMFSPTGKPTTHQIKPDHPRESGEGKSIKYETPAGSGISLDVHPRNAGQVNDASVPLWITEGTKKADALVSQGECVVALQGVWSFQRGGVPLPEWEDIRLHGREVLVAFDSDLTVNPKVRVALEAVVGFLRGRGRS